MPTYNEQLTANNAKIDSIKGKVDGLPEYVAPKPEQEKTVDVVENGTVEVVPDKGKVLSKATVNVNVPGGNHAVEDALISRVWDGGDYTNDRITEVGYGAFAEFGKESTMPFSINLPNVTTAERESFTECGAKAINTPALQYIGDYNSLNRMQNIVSLNFPNLVDVIHTDRPYQLTLCWGCPNLVEFIAPKFAPQLEFSQGFNGNIKLKKVDLGGYKTITDFMAGNFMGDTSLEAVIIRQDTVPDIAKPEEWQGGDPEFGPTVVNGGIGFVYLRKSLVAEAKAKTNWVLFADQIRAIEDYPEITGGL